MMQSLLVASSITILFLTIILTGILTKKEKNKSTWALGGMCLVCMLAAASDIATCLIEGSAYSDGFLTVLWTIAYSMGCLIMISFVIYWYVYVTEMISINPLFYRVPILILFLNYLYVWEEGLRGHIVTIENGKVISIAGLPSITLVLQLLIIFYFQIWAAWNRHSIGMSSVPILGYLGIVPACAAVCAVVFGITDYSYVAVGVALLAVYVHLENESSLKRAEAYAAILAEKNQHLAQEQQTLQQQYRFVEAFSRDIEEAVIVDIQKEECLRVKVQGAVIPPEEREKRSYGEEWDERLQKVVDPEEWQDLIGKLKLSVVVEELQKNNRYICPFRFVDSYGAKYCQIIFTWLGEPNSNFIVAGLKNIDEIIREEKKQQEILQQAREMAEIRLKKIQALSEKLEEALKQTEAANVAKSTFLLNMSHDIRTPMNAIIGYTDLILRHFDQKERCLDYIQKIKSSGEFLLSLINNVLEMARIENGNLVLNEEPMQVGSVCKEMEAVYGELMQQKGIRLTIEKEAHTEYVYADRVKAKEIVLNLVSNSLKYTLEGGSVLLRQEEIPYDREGYTCLRTIVADTGIGISPEYLPKIFDEFTRERNSVGNNIEGTGLGLPIVKKLLELMNGTIEVTSEVGKGTTIVLEIPHRIAEAYVESSDLDAGLEKSVFVGKRILLVEDNDLNAEIATEILSDVGFITERAENGKVCVEMVQKAGLDYYDVILMDIQMPIMNGYQATEMIRMMETEGDRHVPIVAMTANAFEEDRKEAIRRGMNDHIGKPIHIDVLLKTLESVF